MDSVRVPCKNCGVLAKLHKGVGAVSGIPGIYFPRATAPKTVLLCPFAWRGVCCAELAWQSGRDIASMSKAANTLQQRSSLRVAWKLDSLSLEISGSTNFLKLL
eukprot:2274478-Amphidinium_carterae.2